MATLFVENEERKVVKARSTLLAWDPGYSAYLVVPAEGRAFIQVIGRRAVSSEHRLYLDAGELPTPETFIAQNRGGIFPTHGIWNERRARRA